MTHAHERERIKTGRKKKRSERGRNEERGRKKRRKTVGIPVINW